MSEFLGRRVLMIVENNSIPFDKRVWREAKTLKDNGFNVATICPKGKEHKKKYEVIDGIEIHRYNAKFSDGSSKGYINEYLHSLIVIFLLSLKIFFFKKGFNVIHTANPPDTLWMICLFYMPFNVKFIYDEHDLAPESYLSRFNFEDSHKDILYKIQSLFQIISYKLAKVVISTNESYKKIAIERGKLNPESVFVVRNGPDTRYFKAVEPVDVWKNNFDYMVSYIGIMAVQDGVDYIIKTCHYLVHELNRKDIYFVLIGSGDEIEKLKELAKKLEVDDFISFTGRIPDKEAIEILSTADVCLSPDPYNPLNNISTMNKIMEYMVCKSPTVSFDLVEARYSAQDAALYVKNNSVEDFANGIVKLLSDSVLSNKMADFGYRRVINELCWEKQEEKLIEVYKKVLK